MSSIFEKKIEILCILSLRAQARTHAYHMEGPSRESILLLRSALIAEVENKSIFSCILVDKIDGT